jgi:hypothetical protein
MAHLSRVEELIQEWLAGGGDLPGKGKPLDLDEYFRSPPDQRIGHSLLKNAGFVPEEVGLLKELANLQTELEKTSDEARQKQIRQKIQEQQVRLNLQLERQRRNRRSS